MAITPRQMICPQSNWANKCPYGMDPIYITVHNTANDASANNEIAYMNRNTRQVSFHFAVDDNEVVQGIPLNRNAWHAGDGGNGTGNRKTIAIEICYSKSGGERFDKAERLAAKFIAQLLRERGWGMDRVKKHQDWSGKYCLPTDSTELLTKNGWVSLADVQIGDEIAQWDDGKIEFVKIEDVIEPYTTNVVKARGLEATLDHDIICRSNTTDNWKKMKWGDVLSSPFKMLPVGGYYKGEGLPLDDNEIRLLVWIQADGHYAQRVSKYTGQINQLGIEFHFAKLRKAERVHQILNDLEQKHSYNVRSDGTYVIRIHDAKKREQIEKWLDDKRFSWKFLEMDDRQRAVFFDELVLADGSVQNNSYFSTEQQNYDVVSALAALDSRRSYQTTTGNSTALIFSNSNYTIGNKTAKETRETTVSCVTVPSECIVIRQNGRVVVVGNCPHRTLDYGWQRFLDMVNAELNPIEPTVDWVDNAGVGEIDGTTDLINVATGKVVTQVSGRFEYVQTTKDNAWARTQWSKDHNSNNGVATSSFKKPAPTPTIKWIDVESKTMYIKDTANLTNLDTGAVVKVLTGDFTFVQQTEDKKYVRTEYSKEKNLNYGVLLSDLEEIPTPEPEPEPTPEPTPTPTPEPDQTIPILQKIITFIQHIIDLITKKGN